MPSPFLFQLEEMDGAPSPPPPPHLAQLLSDSSDEPPHPDLDLDPDPTPSTQAYMRRRIRALCSAADPVPDPDEALRLLDCIRFRLCGYRPDLAAVLRALCSVGRFAEAHRRLLLHFRHAPSPSPFPSTPIASSSKCSLGSSPDAVSYTALLDSYARLGDGDAARHLLDEMPSTYVAPNSLTCTILIKALL